ncbi:hypothetical protein GCM10022393_23340 [Aquimarina addita]|uniref:Uncharacterized protein n=1 Tax=Aquimarina addita TaxID=870485 RepID=A0ABP6UNT3_9FLAO
MAIEVQHKDIFIPTNEDSIIYNIDTFRYIKSPEEPVENRIQLKIKKTYIKKDQMGFLFSVEVLEREQSNKEGVFGIEDQLNQLQNKLILYTDVHGEITSIINCGQISEQWYDQKASFKKAYKDELDTIDDFIVGVDAMINDHFEFLNLVKKSEVATLLFPPIYDHNLVTTASVDQQRVWYDFFDTTALPFKINTKITAINQNTNGYQLARAGSLDTARFDENKATALMSTLFDVHKYNIKIDLNSFEAYDLNKDHTIAAATLLMNVEIPGVYSYRQISKLKAN